MVRINHTSIWEYTLPSKHRVETSMTIEEENARIFCGLTPQQYDNLVGIHRWSTEDNTIGNFECKSDVIVYYRSQKLTEAILNDLSIKESKRK